MIQKNCILFSGTILRYNFVFDFQNALYANKSNSTYIRTCLSEI